MPDGRRLIPFAAAGAALVLTAGVTGVALWIGGYDAPAAGRALVDGSFGSTQVFLSVTLVRAVPLILTGLAVAVAFKAGVWNIGAEGQLYAGAIVAVVIAVLGSRLPPGLLVPSVLLGAAVGGALWAAVPALMRARLGVGEVITTIRMNFVGIHLAGYVVRGPLQEARGVFPQTDPLVEAARLPWLGDTRLHAGFVMAIGLAIGAWAVLRWTRVGFWVRVVGASPAAASVSGRIPTGRLMAWTLVVSGAVAGLAGGVEVSGVTYALYDGLSPGWGYTAIAVALLAGLHPVGVLATGIFFGALEGGAGAMQREAGIPAAWVSAVEALLILTVLAIDQLRRRFSNGLSALPSGAEISGA